VAVLSDVVEMVRFLFTPDDVFAPEPDAAAKNLGEAAVPVLDASVAALEGVDGWTTAAIEEALRGALIDGLGLKPRKAFAPVRVAVTGRTVSPPLYESMELLGRERSLSRLRHARS
jgi:glutamyl-tRNA synthetase